LEGIKDSYHQACWIKYGLDPRLDPKFRHYQSIDLRGIFFKQMKLVQRSSKVPISTIQLNQLNSDSKLIAAETKTHIIDGIHYTHSRQFQLCDIVDSNYQQLIYSVAYVANEHTAKDGWYLEGHISNIRKKLKQEVKDLRSRVYQDAEEEESGEEQDEAGQDKLQMGLMDYMEAFGDEDEFDILEEDY
jgi:RNA polymerase III transcription factor (TF)IIIC subunit HTH domain